jgi:hypothetical protein
MFATLGIATVIFLVEVVEHEESRVVDLVADVLKRAISGSRLHILSSESSSLIEI